MDSKISSFFEEQQQKAQVAHQLWQQKEKRWSLLRLLFFILWLVTLVFSANQHLYTAVTLLALTFPFVFGLLVRAHQRSQKQRQWAEALAQLNAEELQRLAFQFDELPDGKRYQSHEHPYSYDLDLFGPYSLFQLINRSQWPLGQDRLAEWLKASATAEDITQRQEALQELRQQLPWLQAFLISQRIGMPKETEKTRAFFTWLTETPENPKMLHPIWIWGLTIVSIGVIGLSFTPLVPGFVAIIMIIINTLVIKPLQKSLESLTENEIGLQKQMRNLRQSVLQIEEGQFESPLLQSLQQSFLKPHNASQSIRQLERVTDWLLSRDNLLYWILNMLTFADYHIVRRALRWKQRHAADIPKWLDALASVEALSGMAMLHTTRPDWAFPTIAEENYVLEGKQLGHPLIPENQRVSNDFAMMQARQQVLITGSNMSGKSTFLRTLGTNLVLAQMGAPVCANAFGCSRTAIFTSMRTQDNLKENISSFYAELKRLRQLLDTIQGNELPTFYLLDEILKGTNSEDRHHGAIGLIKQLQQMEGWGLISTHDLALSQLEKDMPQLQNYSFNSRLEDGEVLFDYKLHKGPCTTFNASQLMQLMGIGVG